MIDPGGIEHCNFQKESFWKHDDIWKEIIMPDIQSVHFLPYACICIDTKS